MTTPADSREAIIAAGSNIKERDYWLKRLAGNPVKSYFPYDYERSGFEYSPAEIAFELPPPVVSRLLAAANRSDLRIYIILLAGLVLLLDKYTGNRDIMVAVPIYKQEAAGDYINTTLVVRSRIYDDMPFKELLRRIGRTFFDAAANQNYPIKTLLYKLDIPYSEEEDFPLCDVAVLLENIQDKRFISHIKTNMNFLFSRAEEKISCVLAYNAALYKKSTAQRIAAHFERLLDAALGDLNSKPGDISLLSEAETRQRLDDYNDTAEEFPQDKTLPGLFADQAARTPDKTALVAPASRAAGKLHLTYRELLCTAAGLALVLQEKGVAPGHTVALLMTPSPAAICGILGILLAGGAYVPLDPFHPADRRSFILKDSGAKLLVAADKKESEKVREWEGEIYDIENLFCHSYPLNFLPPYLQNASNLAYIIYTSGSTGRPKGVMIEHRSVVNYISWAARRYAAETNLEFPFFTSIAFDLTVTAIFVPLLTGNTIVVYGETDEADTFLPGTTILPPEQTGVIKLTPSHLKLARGVDQAAAQRPIHRGITRFILGGEQLETKLAQDTHADYQGAVELYNEYGPTEATVGCMIHRFDPAVDKRKSVPIGKPAANMQVYILDRLMHPVPPGTPGELWTAGAQLARGYLNNPELTAEKFVQGGSFRENHPPAPPAKVFDKSFLGVQGAIFQKSPLVAEGNNIYKTGDLARWLPDGNIECLGRIDFQVKIRGWRIEPGEIERRLLQIAGITEALVITRTYPDPSPDDEKYLCAYITGQREFSPQELRESLSEALPEYMIPAYFVQLEKFPIAGSGKIDNRALPLPDFHRAGVACTPPRDDLEERLAAIWAGVLKIDQGSIGIDTGFFDSGGHSLRATILISRICKEFNAEIPLSAVFRCPTIRQFGNFLRRSRPAAPRYAPVLPVEKKEYYPQSSAQERLFFLDQFESIGTSYNVSAAYTIQGKLDRERLEKAINALIERHETLRTAFVLMEKRPVQRILAPSETVFKIAYYDAAPGMQSGPGIETIMRDFVKRFDLARAPLLRVALIESAQQHIMIYDMHHIMSDGTSMGILMQEFVRLYDGAPLPPPHLQYKDFSSWQERLCAAGKIKAQQDYWLNLYAHDGEIPRLRLPTDFPRPKIFDFAGDRYRFEIPTQDALPFQRLAGRHGATTFMNLLAALNVLFYKYSYAEQEEIIIGCSIAGRRHSDLQDIIGMFVNELAILNRLAAEKSYLELLEEVKTNTVAAFENQDVQFEDLVERLNLARDPAHNPLFDICLVVQNFERSREKAAELSFTPNDYRSKTAKFDMTFSVFESRDALYFDLEYCTSLYTGETIARLAKHLTRLVLEIGREPGITLGRIPMLDEDERREMLGDLNDTAVSFLQEKTTPQLFEEQARRSPDRIAIIYEDRCLSYSALLREAGRLADYLYTGRHVCAGRPVAVLADNSILQAVEILAVQQAGAPYIPLDPAAPRQRISYMISDAQIEVVLSMKKYIRLLNRMQWVCPWFRTFLCLDSADIYSEKEEEKNTLMNPELWDYTAESAQDEISVGGWQSSYTGRFFSIQEMAEYGDNVLQKLIPLLDRNKRVLEIGSASGITMFRIAPRVGFYYAIDLSPVMIEKTRARVEQAGYRNISLACLPAHSIDTLDERDFDIVILNSVIQSFHGHNYLRQVLRKAVNMIAGSGFIFIGDVMDQDLQPALIREMIDFKNADKDKNYRTKTDWDSELFVSRAFFQDLTVEIPAIKTATCTPKIYTLENELTKFRYDALLEVDNSSRPTRAARPGSHKIKYQEDSRALAAFSPDRAFPPAQPADPAYIIYTSGTTGRPKGVIVEHRSLANYLTWAARTYLDNRDVAFPLYTSPAFDLTLTSIYLPLISGKTIVVYDGSRSSLPIYAVVNDNKVDLVKATPSHLKLLLPGNNRENKQQNSFLKKFIVGGEELETSLAQEIYWRFTHGSHPPDIYNEYGPTEAAIGCMIYRFSPDQTRSHGVPIGAPIDNVEIYILDRSREPMPTNAIGEIYITGIGLARGYLNQPELTAEKFASGGQGALFEKIAPWTPTKAFEKFYAGHFSPLTTHHSLIDHRLYRTGDLARRRRNGDIDFCGRADEQVKIRGYRIETKEVEQRLSAHSDITEAAVVLLESTAENETDTFLCAYYAADKEIETKELREYLARQMPDYMIPTYFVRLDKLPLTRSGKLVRRALPRPSAAAGDAQRRPRSEIEKKLANAWSRVLNIPESAIDSSADFFASGGHSLKAVNLIAEIHRCFDVRLPIAEIFKTPTLDGLARCIANAVKERYTRITALEKRDYYALSPAQERLYILHRLTAETTPYNTPLVMRLIGDPPREAIACVFAQLIKRHEILRTSFPLVNGKPVQQVHDARHIEFAVEYEKDHLEAVQVKRYVERFIRPFDMAHAPLLRAGMLSIQPREHLFIVDMHHIITDGISQQILTREFMTLYAQENLPGIRLQYKDYAGWRFSPPLQAELKNQENYWLTQFSQAPPLLDLPTDYTRPKIQDFAGARLDFELSRMHSDRITTLAKEERTTPYMMMLTIFAVLLAKLSGQEDIVIGTPTAGRRHADLQGMIGMFVNTLTLRRYPRADKSFREFLGEVRQQTLAAYENQDYPFEDLVERVTPAIARNLAHNPIFDVMFMFDNIYLPAAAYTAPQAIESRRLKLQPYEYKNSTAKFDLTLFGQEKEGRLCLTFEYCTRLFKQGTIARFARYFKMIQAQVLANPQVKIADIEIISQAEKRSLLYRFNRTAADYPRQQTIHGLFAQQVARAPYQVALVGAPLLTLTYRELDRRAELLAGSLREKDLAPGHIAALLAPPSTDAVIGILAILKTGAAYLPIDPGFPPHRSEYMLCDSASALLLTGRSLYQQGRRFEKWQGKIFYFDEPGQGRIVSQSPARPGDLCYVIYTSGTTGRPKGVAVDHRAVVNYTSWAAGNYLKQGNRNFPLFTSLSFDLTVTSIFTPLASGGAIIVFHDEDSGSRLDIIKQVIQDERLGVIKLTPAHLKLIAGLKLDQESRTGQPRCFIVGGEAFDIRLAQDLHSCFAPRVEIYNEYGPTEAAVGCMIYRYVPGGNYDRCASVPLGTPASNMQIYLLDRSRKPVLSNITGEIYISGDGLAGGYLNQPELTAEKFVLNHNRSYRSNKSNRSYIMYRTGDLARRLEYGVIEFLGRSDHQVKIRGFRIEPAEIERHLSNHEGIKEALVLAVKNHKENNPAEISLCAYIVPQTTHPGDPLEPEKLREYLARRLPLYMIPQHFFQLEKIPLTANGKPDRAALPRPDGSRPLLASVFKAPSTDREKLITGVWQEVLNVERIGIHDNFFDLGGNSLGIIQVNSKLKDALHIDVPITALFEYPTIDALCRYLQLEAKASDYAAEEVANWDVKHDQAVNMLEHTLEILNSPPKYGRL